MEIRGQNLKLVDRKTGHGRVGAEIEGYAYAGMAYVEPRKAASLGGHMQSAHGLDEAMVAAQPQNKMRSKCLKAYSNNPKTGVDVPQSKEVKKIQLEWQTAYRTGRLPAINP
jgi:hypothetical protein